MLYTDSAGPLTITVTSGSTDLTTATSATVYVRWDDESVVVWPGTIAGGATPTQCVVTHQLSGGLRRGSAGMYVELTTPTGKVRTDPISFTVKGRFGE